MFNLLRGYAFVTATMNWYYSVLLNYVPYCFYSLSTFTLSFVERHDGWSQRSFIWSIFFVTRLKPHNSFVGFKTTLRKKRRSAHWRERLTIWNLGSWDFEQVGAHKDGYQFGKIDSTPVFFQVGNRYSGRRTWMLVNPVSTHFHH